MQTCYNCGKTVSDETLICPDCGALVRRYTDPPKTEQAMPQNISPAQGDPAAHPRVRFYGPVKVWLIILIASSAYLCFSALVSLFLAANTDVLTQMLTMPGMEVYQELLGESLELLPQAIPLFAVMAVLLLGKLLCHIWLLRSGRKKPFFVGIALSMVGLVLFGLLGGSLLSIAYLLDPLVTWFGLRRFWPYMQK